MDCKLNGRRCECGGLLLSEHFISHHFYLCQKYDIWTHSHGFGLHLKSKGAFDRKWVEEFYRRENSETTKL